MGSAQSYPAAGKATLASCMCDNQWLAERTQSSTRAKWSCKLQEWLPIMSQGDSRMPEARSGHSTHQVGRSIYMFGGYNEGHCLADMYQFDLSTFSWALIQPKGDAPDGRASHASCSVVGCGASEGAVYVHGGSGAEWGRSSKDDLYVFDTATREWAKVQQTGRLPPPMYGHTIVPHGDKELVLFGGTTGWDYFNAVYIFDIATSKWRQLHTVGKAPSMRYKHQCVVHGHSLLVMGGGQFHAPDYSFDVHILDLKTKRWDQILAPNAPSGRLAHSCALARGLPCNFRVRGQAEEQEEAAEGAFPGAGEKLLPAASGSGGYVSNEELGGGGAAAPDGSDGSDGGAAAPREGPDAGGAGPVGSEEEERDFVIVFGGKDNRDCKLNDLYAFDTVERRWITLCPHEAPGGSAPSARDFHCMAVADNNVLIFGGCAGEERLNDCWRFTLNKPSPPSLQMLCTRFVRESMELSGCWKAIEHLPEELRLSIRNVTPMADELDFRSHYCADRLDRYRENHPCDGERRPPPLAASVLHYSAAACEMAIRAVNTGDDLHRLTMSIAS